jgi:hypothetical protein
MILALVETSATKSNIRNPNALELPKVANQVCWCKDGCPKQRFYC